MSQLKTNFENLLQEKQIPARYIAIEDGHHLYHFQMNIAKSRAVSVEIILQNSQEADRFTDVQIVYRHIHMLDAYEKRTAALEIINELNEMKTGYYHLYLAGDGEIFLKSLIRVGTDITGLYETLIYGSRIAANLLPELTEKLGASAPI